MTFEEWLRNECFQKPTSEAYELAKSAWKTSRDNMSPEELRAEMRKRNTGATKGIPVPSNIPEHT